MKPSDDVFCVKMPVPLKFIAVKTNTTKTKLADTFSIEELASTEMNECYNGSRIFITLR